MRSHVPMILLGDAQAMDGEIHAADAVLARKSCSSLELLERIKVMSARKRGPRKGAHANAAGRRAGCRFVESRERGSRERGSSG